MDLVLASGSPRRAELLKRLGVPYRVIVSEVEEGSHVLLGHNGCKK